MTPIGYENGCMYVADMESLLARYKAEALRVDSVGTLEMLILADDVPVLVWMDIQEIEQLKTQ